MYAWVPVALTDPTYYNQQPLRAHKLIQADFLLAAECEMKNCWGKQVTGEESQTKSDPFFSRVWLYLLSL